jgi:hypothetical protein
MKLSAEKDAAQIRFRDSVAEQARLLIEAEEFGFVEAIVACMGVASILAGVLPPSTRRSVVEQVELHFAEMVELRAKEIRSGEFDDAFARANQ